MIAAKIKLLPQECNAVARDKIWKKRVDVEVTAARLYPARWSYIAKTYKELLKDLKTKQPLDVDKTRLPSHLRLPPLTPIEKLVNVYPSPKPYPPTTTSHIGWRSGIPQYKLEKYGSYCRPKGCIYKTFKWPLDAI